MLSNYFKVSLRNLLKNPLFTSLNVLGLALGLLVSLMLFLHVRQEMSFDRYHTKSERIQRVVLGAFWDPEHPEMIANAPNAVAPAMKADIPAVEQAARILRHEFGQSAFVMAGDKKVVETMLFWADPALVDIFDIPVLAGDLRTALSQPNCLALSRLTAVRYFGTSNVLGQVVKIDRMPPLEIKAVFEDFPPNSSLEMHVLGSFQSIKWASERLVWNNASFETWVLLSPDADRRQVEAQLTALLDKNVPKANQRYSLWLQPLNEVHLYSSNLANDYTERIGDPKQVGILGALAIAVLMIACFNYMNLSTARSQMRFREVGINKTMGASRWQLALRFYTETMVLTGIALFLALGLLFIGIPFFNQLADKQLIFKDLIEPVILLAICGIVLTVVLLSGSYPAFLLSGFQPKNLLQTTFRRHSGAGILRQSLVTAQFAAAIVLIVGTVVLYRQMQFIQQKKLGFEPEQVVAITTVAAENKTQLDGLIQGLKNLSSITAVCRAQTYPGRIASTRSVTKSEEDEGAQLFTNRVTPGIEKVLGIKMLAGTGLPEKTEGDTIVNVILTKKAVDYLGMTPEEAIGKRVNCDLGPNSFVRGVVEDVHSESLHKSISAYAFHDYETESRRYLLVKMNTQNLPETMRQVETEFQKAMPQSAFECAFLDENLAKLYRSEVRTANVMFVFSLLSILVSCLGLFGLAAFAAERRTKEIGIRKVLGASVTSLTGLLAKDFLKLVLLAIVIASPIAYYFMQRWLSDFAYRIDMQWWMFAVAGILAVAIAFLTVGAQAVRAALANPVKSLRNE
jgi:putative ABC transport system permease protein